MIFSLLRRGIISLKVTSVNLDMIEYRSVIYIRARADEEKEGPGITGPHEAGKKLLSSGF